MKKSIISIIAIALTCFSLAGTTFAWLVAKSDTNKTTFTVGNINISLAEHTSKNQTIVPGATLIEEPEVIVRA